MIFLRISGRKFEQLRHADSVFLKIINDQQCCCERLTRRLAALMKGFLSSLLASKALRKSWESQCCDFTIAQQIADNRQYSLLPEFAVDFPANGTKAQGAAIIHTGRSAVQGVGVGTPSMPSVAQGRPRWPISAFATTIRAITRANDRPFTGQRRAGIIPQDARSSQPSSPIRSTHKLNHL